MPNFTHRSSFLSWKTLEFAILEAFSYRRCATITCVHSMSPLTGYHQHILRDFFIGSMNLVGTQWRIYERLILKRMVKSCCRRARGAKSIPQIGWPESHADQGWQKKYTKVKTRTIYKRVSVSGEARYKGVLRSRILESSLWYTCTNMVLRTNAEPFYRIWLTRPVL